LFLWYRYFYYQQNQKIIMAMLSTQALAELRHQIAAVIDPSLAVSVEPKTAADIAKAAAYVAQRKSIKVVAGAFVDGAALPTDDPFLNWVTAGGLIVPSAQLPDFILQLVGAFMNKSGINQKGG
jgi:hypothetical protein